MEGGPELVNEVGLRHDDALRITLAWGLGFRVLGLGFGGWGSEF